MLPPGSRRSKIRPPRKLLVGQADDVDFDKTWTVLAGAIDQIQQKNVSNLSYEQLYRKAYLLVLRKHGARLYDSVSKTVAKHLLNRRQQLVQDYADNRLNASQNEDFMRAVLVEWDGHLQAMKFVSDVLMYLNRVYVKEAKRLLVYDLGIQLFKENVVKYNGNEVGDRLVRIVIEEITRSRQGQVITSKMHITRLVAMMELLAESGTSDGENYYQRYFEDAFLGASDQFFRAVSAEQLAAANGAQYLHEISQFIRDEESRTRFYLPEATYPKLVNLMNMVLVRDKIDQIVSLPFEQHGLSYLLDPVLSNTFGPHKPHHVQELKILYELIGRIDPDRNLLKLRLKEAVVSQGQKIAVLVRESIDAGKKPVTSTSTPFALKWIVSVLEYQKQLSQVVLEAFSHDFSIEQAVTLSMRDFINTGKLRKGVDFINAPEVLSVYIDHFIRQLSKSSVGTKRVETGETSVFSVDQTDDLITKSVQFLRFIKDKDAFEAHYANHFAKRFLNLKVGAGGDIEELVISKLGEELGATSLDKVIKMNKDIKLSQDLTVDWKQHVPKQEGMTMDLELKVCSVSDWPKSMTKDYKSFARDSESMVEGLHFIWPSQLRAVIKDFEEFWINTKKNDNKLLFWCPKFGSMDLKITYPSRTYDINLLTYAGVIMLLFAPQLVDSTGDAVSAFAEPRRELLYTEIAELSGIPESDLKRQLQSIAVAPRLRLLVKTPMSKEVNASDSFRLNENFKSPSAKVKVLTVSASSSAGRDKTLGKTEQEEESQEVQANITEGRKIEVNAAIVRIMKSRQTITHNDLLAELIKQLRNRFQPLTLLIKQRIEDLIEKEYLKRDDDDRALYHYVA